jgi:hypothetical protein
MNQEIKKRWVEALRSGRYAQTQNYLRSSFSPNAFCCLGVLCDIVKSEVKGTWDVSYCFTTPMTSVVMSGFPPQAVMSLANLTHSKAEQLAKMNDAGKSFEEIAAVIEML